MPGLVNIVIGGQNTGAVAALRQVEGQLQAFAQRAAASLGAAFGVGAIVEFARRTIEAADALDEMAQKTGIAVRQLSGLGAVAAADDVSLQNLQLAIKGLSEWMVKSGQASRDVNEVLLEQADLFARMPDGAAKTALAMDRFGRAGQDMIPFLNRGSEAIREQIREAEEFGAVIGSGFAREAARFNDNLHRLALLLQGIFVQSLKAILPDINKLLDQVIRGTKEFGLHQGVILTVIDLYKKLATALEYVSAGFEAVSIIASKTQAQTKTEAAALLVSPLAFLVGKVKKHKEEIDAELMALAVKSTARLREIEQIGTGTPDRPDEKPEASTSALLRIEALKTQLAQQQGFLAADAAAREVSAGERRKRQLEDLTLIERTLQALRIANSTAHAEGLISQDAMLREEIGLRNQLLAVDKQRHELLADDLFFIRMQDNLNALADSWGNLARNAADALTNSIQAGVNGVTNAIVDAIYMTRSWAQVFQQVGRAIITELIRVVVQWIVQMTIVRGLQKLFHTEQQVQATQRAAAEAPGAALASTASYGAAAIIGAVALAAILALALASAAGAFAEGGIVRGGEQLIRVNERGTEAILNAQALANVGEGFVAALNAGLPIQQAAAVSPAPSIKNNQQVNVLVYDDKARLNEYLQSAEGSSVVVDLMRKNLHNITGKS